MRLVMLLVLPALAVAASGADFFVSPAGSPAGNGSSATPWDLATALSQTPAVVGPGSRVWLAGGTYSPHATLLSTLAGSASRPVIVRTIPGERATIDCAAVLAATPGADCLLLKSLHTWYWGLEITNSSDVRLTASPGAAASPRGIGIHSQAGPGTKLINLVVHDVGTTLFESQPSGLEIYGLIAYNSGWEGPDRSHGPGIYIRNRGEWPTKTIRDSVVFQHYRQGLQGFGSFDNVFSNFVVEGNTFFNNGIGVAGFHRNLMFGNTNSAHRENVFRENSTYFTGTGGSGSNMFGGDGGCADIEVLGNVFAHGPNRDALQLNDCVGATIEGNVFHGSTEARVGGIEQPPDEFRQMFPANEYFSAELGAPSGVRVSVRPNRYEGGRALITVYNWDRLSAVPVDLRALGLRDHRVSVRSVQDYYGAARELTVRRSQLMLPMSGWTVVAPHGYAGGTLPATLPEFGVFVVEWDVGRRELLGARR